MSEKRKRNDLTIYDKLSILQSYDNLPKMGQREAAIKLQISQPKNDARINGPILRQKAEELAKKIGIENFIASEGWFHRWKKRENIVYKRTYGEQKDADFSAAENWLKTEWPKIISEYTPDNVYNADETGLFYRALPEHSYLFKNENAKGCKISKERITVLCCASMSGKKQKLLVIGKSKNPRCFKSVKCLPVDYYANTNAWMTSVIFNEWLIKWDKQLNNKTVLLIDNCPAHVVSVSLKHIRIIFLPANTTSLIQPCDQGIIKTLKSYYRKQMRTRIIDNIENTNDQEKLSANELAKQTNLLDALHLITMAWDQVTDKTIRNCFKHGGFAESVEGEEEEEYEEVDLDFENWLKIDENIPTTSNFTEEDIVHALSQTNEPGEIENEETDTEKPPSSSEMREALRVLRRGVQQHSSNFELQYKYEHFINDLLTYYQSDYVISYVPYQSDYIKRRLLYF
ncbi:tigger transposable element-derived protein 6-like [Melanaphis sacchari]|uniref:tigger transposable element-derived protein 6-like n=1 Tax=Melanaphis sacchari TaxID=742174 RepID=UPI000DC149D3|nr:tigger transposable element-derived protein 6-like [Melanaphis sacchari]